MNDEELIKETMMLDYSQLVMHNVYMIKENKRLNNVINEYTKWLNEQVDYMTHHSIERMIAFDCCKHKLQELKGDGDE